ncbi:hypothetical protein ILUMI_03194 [Ignelater luminosus]|uniref:Uncharacterized protein n=1 Tax=Ignelater luminosus TaxID=2038154 RepID=A0A8K0DMB1_IGNLU|nr:hypothetical protein ILUMI_03194 [Ignelater luminosus]
MWGVSKLIAILALAVLVRKTNQQLKDPEFMKTYEGYRAACTKEVGLEEAYVIKVWSEKHFPNDDKLKCYFKCTSMKLGVMDETGDIIDDNLRKVAAQFNDDETKTEIVTECGAIKGSNLCETAFTLMACIRSAQLD